jgi:hypothetical protein
MLSAITAAAAPRSVLTVIAASAAFTYRVSSSTTSNPALARTACNHQVQRARYIRTAAGGWRRSRATMGLPRGHSFGVELVKEVSCAGCHARSGLQRCYRNQIQLAHERHANTLLTI